MNERALTIAATDLGAQMRRVAHKVTACPDDAEDATQRALLLIWQKCPCEERHQIRSWALTTVRREALAIVRTRARRGVLPIMDGAEDTNRRFADLAGDPLEVVVDRDTDRRRGDLLDALKPDERTALALQGAGLSYREIMAARGWTYTKVNRCIAEGRAALREQLVPQESDR